MGGSAEIYVLMPLRNAERNALIEILFGEALGRGIHYANQFVIFAVFFVEQRSRMLGVESWKQLPIA
jgi:hypothetical protein